MPPRGSKKSSVPKPSPSLQNCSIALAANSAPSDFLGGIKLAALKDKVSCCGGSYTTKIDDCTHLVVTLKQYQKELNQVKKAIAKQDVHIVSFEWLEEALTASGPVDESSYLLHSQSNPTANTNNNTTNLIQSTESDDAKPKGKRSRSNAKDDKIKDEDEQDDDEPDQKKFKSDAGMPNVTKSLSMNIPVDDVLPSQSYKVHIADDSTIFDVTLNQTNSGSNANKFYRIQLLQDHAGLHWCWTRWGRVGERGQSAMLGEGDIDGAIAIFEKKFKDKNGNIWADRDAPVKAGKYAFVERSYEDSDDEGADELPGADKRKASKASLESEEAENHFVESKLPGPVQRLMKLIFNQEHFNSTMAQLNYDANKMPLGKLSKNTLLRGYEVLKQLAALIGAGTGGSSVQDLSNQYLSLIPHSFGRNRPPVLSNMAMIKQETELLEALTDMQLANDIMKDARSKKDQAEEVNLLDRQYQGLGMQEMTPLDPKSTEFKELKDYLIKSVGQTHGTNYKIQDVFRIERNGEKNRFENSAYASISNSDRRLLWHGSRCTNFGGILSQGLRIAPPEAPVSGYMFGKGVYLADMSSKSAGYCASHSSGNIGLLLLCEAELGSPPLKLTGADYEAGSAAKKAGAISTWGVGRTAPKLWKGAECVHENLKGVIMPDVITAPPSDTNQSGTGLYYNEYIVYDVAQIKLRYLFRVEF